MENERYRLWDIRMKVITVVISLLVIVIGFCQFLEKEENRVNAEYKRINRESKAKTYMEVASIIGEIMSSIELKDSTLLDNSMINFTKLYYGESIIIENCCVSKQLQNFRVLLDQYRDGYKSVKDELTNLGVKVVKEMKKDLESESNTEKSPVTCADSTIKCEDYRLTIL